MILEALVRYYEALVDAGILEPGFRREKVSYAIEIDETGSLLSLIPLKYEIKKGMKSFWQPQKLSVPIPENPTSDITPSFLYDKSKYILGVGDEKHNRDCFNSSKLLHLRILGELTSLAAVAVCNFFRTWEPDKATEHPDIIKFYNELSKGEELVFIVNGKYAHEDSQIREAWL